MSGVGGVRGVGRGGRGGWFERCGRWRVCVSDLSGVRRGGGDCV